MGYRLPVFDIKVSAEKESAYSQISQNELALQLYNNGFFNPQYTDQALATLDMMEFQGKDGVMQKIAMNGGMYREMLMMKQQMLQMAQIIDKLTGSSMAAEMADGINQQATAEEEPAAAVSAPNTGGGENKMIRRSRERAATVAQPR